MCHLLHLVATCTKTIFLSGKIDVVWRDRQIKHYNERKLLCSFSSGKLPHQSLFLMDNVCQLCFAVEQVHNLFVTFIFSSISRPLPPLVFPSYDFSFVSAFNLSRCFPIRFCTWPTQSSFSTLQSGYVFSTLLNALLSPSQVIQRYRRLCVDNDRSQTTLAPWSHGWRTSIKINVEILCCLMLNFPLLKFIITITNRHKYNTSQRCHKYNTSQRCKSSLGPCAIKTYWNVYWLASSVSWFSSSTVLRTFSPTRVISSLQHPSRTVIISSSCL